MNQENADADIVIRQFRRSDTERVVEITVEVFEPVSMDAIIEKEIGPAAASWKQIKADHIRRELRDYPEGCFVAEAGGKVVGYVTTSINRQASRGQVPNLAVSAAAQGRGIGRRLLQRALEHFQTLGLRQAKIETLACNQVGQHLYPSLGFQEIVRQIHYVMSLR